MYKYHRNKHLIMFHFVKVNYMNFFFSIFGGLSDEM